jgi:UDP-N-acetylmuramoyl-L-alanyl-D-glutamate--2,6-diaminopimelate ligase
VSLLSTSGDPELEIAGIAMDSRQVKPGFAFVAIKGAAQDGHQYITQAINNGAKAIICQNLPAFMEENVAFIQVKDSNLALGTMASNFYDHPSSKLKLVAVTGTNGKTTTVTLLFQLFKALGYKTGMLSTVVNRIDEEEIPSALTTPDALSMQAMLAEMVKKGIEFCFMEASSHAIVQERVAGLQLKGAVFTNISHDHLDYHGTFDNYIKAKKKLFDDLPQGSFALSNLDDKRGRVVLQNTRAQQHFFALEMPCEFKGRILTNTLQGLEMELEGKPVWFRIAGAFNAYNLIAAYAVARLLGMEEEEVLMALSELPGAPGRLEKILPGSPIIGIVDYAHTPDALENVLSTIGEARQGKEQIHAVVGCGGNRDAAKRPLMAAIACKLADKVILTSDNPRFEDPDAIIDDMMKGVGITQRRKVLRIADRKEAIQAACAMAAPGDIVLVAGKGHETYQEINGERFPFDDRKILALNIQRYYKEEK